MDDNLVFDNRLGLAEKFSFVAEAAYEIVITATVAAQRAPGAVSVDFTWRSDTVREHTVPQFFLFDSAQEIALSPFPVSVSAS